MAGENRRRANEVRHDAAESAIPTDALHQHDMNRVEVQTQNRIVVSAEHRLDSRHTLCMKATDRARLSAQLVRSNAWRIGSRTGQIFAPKSSRGGLTIQASSRTYRLPQQVLSTLRESASAHRAKVSGAIRHRIAPLTPGSR